MADPDPDSPEPVQRAKQAQARSRALRKKVARTAEAVAETERDSAQLHRRLAAAGGPLAAEAREHADWAAEVATKERAEAERLREADAD